MHVPQLFIRHVGVYLGGGDVGVAEEGLDRAKVGAVGEQVGGKAVADDVGVTFLEIPASMARCFIILSTERG